MKRTTLSERGLVLAPRGRDATIAASMLSEAGLESLACASLPTLIAELDRGAAFVVVTEEALATTDLHPLAAWLGEQEEWSDLPFVLLTSRGGGLERNPAAGRYLELLGNVTFLERPFHPTTIISLVQSALRGRLRQYEARARLQALRESETRYRTLFDTMDEGFCVIEFVDGPDGPLSDYVHVEANAAYERHAGIPHVVGQRVREMVPDEAAGWIDLYRGVLDTGQPLRFERELVATGRYLELAAFRVEPPSKRQVAVLFQDITARREAEKALRESEERFRALVDTLPALIFVTRGGENVYVNRRYEEFTGLPGEALLGRGYRDVTHPDDLARLDAEIVTAGGDFETELRLRAADGSWRSVLCRSVALSEAGGPVAIGGMIDVQDLADARTELAAANDRLAGEVAAAVADREAALAQLHEAQKLETIGQLTGGVAHDFNNLLTPIIGALDMVGRRHGQDPRSARLIDGALQSAERAKTLVQRLLGFARRQTLETRAVDLASLVDGMRDLIVSSVGSTVELRIAAEKDLPPALVDPNQLELAILNLAVNARDAMPGGGSLTIGVERALIGPNDRGTLAPGTYVRLSVSDTGKGMDEAVLARAIEPFYSTKELGKGTGLGLSMVHGFAAQLGGAFTLASTPGEGTRADLYLPVAEGTPLTAPLRPAAEAVKGRSLSILLIDDEPLVRAGTAEMLRELGHEVAEADSGMQALEKLAGGLTVDVVITDYMMPRMDGAELADRLCAAHPELPLLVVTGYAGGDLDLGLPQLAKPFRQSDIAAALDRLLDQSNVVRLPVHRR